jgi:hypothetical protein
MALSEKSKGFRVRLVGYSGSDFEGIGLKEKDVELLDILLHSYTQPLGH